MKNYHILLMIIALFALSCQKEVAEEIPFTENKSELSTPGQTKSSNSCGLIEDQTLECGGMVCGTWGEIGYYNYEPIPLLLCPDDECTVTLSINQLDVPNRFIIYNSFGVVVSSGWIGLANYPGPWGQSLDNDNPGLEYLSFTAYGEESYTLEVETVIVPNTSKKGAYNYGADEWEVSMICDCACGEGCDDDCGETISDYYGQSGYHVYTDIIDLTCVEPGCEVSLRMNPQDVPNRFYVYTPDNVELLHTPWLGESDTPGPWGSSLYNPGDFFEYTIIKGTEEYWTLRTETAVNEGLTDHWFVDVVCPFCDVDYIPVDN